MSKSNKAKKPNDDNECINFYTLPSIKKDLPKYEDKQLEYTGMNIDTRILVCGASGTGKTNALMNYLYQTSKPKNGTFQHILLCYKVEEVLYDNLFKKLGPQNITAYTSLKSFPDVQQFPTQSEDKYLVIFDDCVNDEDKASVKKVKDYFAFSRKKGVTTIFITQSYFDTPKFVRKNMMYLLLLSINGKKDLNNILRDHNVKDLSSDQLRAIYDICTKKLNPGDMPFMKINCSHVDKDLKFSRNFLGYVHY